MSARPDHPLASSASWELEEDLRHIGRMAAAHRTASQPTAAGAEGPAASATTESTATLRIDPPVATREAAEDATNDALDDAAELPAWSAAAATWLGLTALSCGGLLAGWSLWAGRPELMPVALPGAVAGLVGLALGQLAARR